MFIMDLPVVPVQETPIVLAQANAPAGATPQPDFILNDCQETESTGDPQSAMRAVDPAYMLKNYLYASTSGKVIADLAAIKTMLLIGTQHGKIFSEVDNTGLTSYHYDAEPNYIGNDRAVFLAEFEGKVYKIVLELHVFTTVGENSGTSTCPEPQLIKVTKPAKPSSGASGFGSGYDLSSVSITFADLQGAALIEEQ